MKKILLAVVAVLSMGMGAGAMEVIETEYVNPLELVGENWTLDISLRPPQRIVMTNAAGEREAYWYVVYLVTNRTGRARQFMPGATVLTDTGKFIRDGSFPAVVEEVRKQYRLSELKSSVAMLGAPPAEGEERRPNLKDGEEEAKQGIFVFPAGTERINSFKLFITGLSGQFIIREIPSAREGQETVPVVMRKTMEIEYAVPGDETRLDRVTVHQLKRRWMWR
jgi:hypothetical protein